MEIPEARTVRGVKPQDYTNSSLQLKITGISAEKRSNEKGGEFTQFCIQGTDEEGQEREVRFLFAADLQPLRTAYGSSSDSWIGKPILVSGKKDGKFYRVFLKPVEVSV